MKAQPTTHMSSSFVSSPDRVAAPPDFTAPASASTSGSRTARTVFVRALPVISRLLLGLVFFVFGLNGFLDFVPRPATPPPEPAVAFFTALFATGYMIPLIAGTQLLAGALLLAGRFVPLALVLLAPVLVHIVAYHVFLDPSGMAIVAALCAFELHLAWVHRAAFRPLLRARTEIA